jgi:hypothetical protein
LIQTEHEVDAVKRFVYNDIVSKSELRLMLQDKIAKSEVMGLLPDLSQLEEKINAHNKEERRQLEERIHASFKSFDARLV